MDIEFEFRGLSLQARVAIMSPAVPARTSGHPDTWFEGESAEIVIKELRYVRKSEEYEIRELHSAIFLLESDFAEEIEIAAIQAAEKQAEANRADALIWQSIERNHDKTRTD